MKQKQPMELLDWLETVKLRKRFLLLYLVLVAAGFTSVVQVYGELATGIWAPIAKE